MELQCRISNRKFSCIGIFIDGKIVYPLGVAEYQG